MPGAEAANIACLARHGSAWLVSACCTGCYSPVSSGRGSQLKCAFSTAISSMCRDTIRAGSRNITACSAPSCASSPGFISLRPRQPAAERSRRRDRLLDHRDQGRRLADPHRPTTSCALRTSSSAISRADLAHRLLRGLDLFAPDLPRHRLPLHEGELAVRRPSSPIRISCCLVRGAAALASSRPSCSARGSRRSACPRLRYPAARPRCSSPLLWARAEIHGKAHLRALSAVRHDLDLAVLAPRAPGMGPAASTASRSISAMSRAPATPRRSCWSATARDRSSAPRSWRAR